MNLKAQWQAWCQRIAVLSQRERVLILLTGLVLLGAAGLYGWLDGADTRLQQDRMALSAAERDLEIMELENLGKQARLKRDPNQGVRDQLAQVETDLARIDDELKAQTVESDPGARDAAGAGGAALPLRQPSHAGAQFAGAYPADGGGAEGQSLQAWYPASA